MRASGRAISMGLEEDAEGGAVDDMGGGSDERRLVAIVEGEQPRGLQRGDAGPAGAIRRDARMHSGEERDEDGQGDSGVQQPEQTPEPPSSTIKESERGGVAKGEALPVEEVDEEAGDAGAVGIFGEQRAEEH